MTKRPDKIPFVEERIHACAENGEFLYSRHCIEQMETRNIGRDDVTDVLKSGWREKKKDSFNEPYQEWRYAIRGHTLDNEKDLRIVVSFNDALGMLVVTAIDLGIKD
ncbi:MAG: DUF4258 domain-containing protein [Candidatus Sumerlaeota bacterium]|nr:DUF4258 domain-containing protein [Candidatus Sumerlaeota bacterium]